MRDRPIQNLLKQIVTVDCDRTPCVFSDGSTMYAQALMVQLQQRRISRTSSLLGGQGVKYTPKI